MICPSCDGSNLPDANFCDGCGAVLAAECLSCGTRNRSRASFCRQCGIEIEVRDWDHADDGENNTKETQTIAYELDSMPVVSDARADQKQLLMRESVEKMSNISRELREHSAESLRLYTELWFDSAARSVADISPADIAYHVFLHSALLYRFTNRIEVLDGLRKWPPMERTRLAVSACEYLSGLTILETAESLLANDAIEVEELEQLEDLLLARDGLEEVFAVLTPRLVELSESDRAICAIALDRAMALAAEFDHRMRQRPDVLSVIGHTLAAMEPHFRASPDPQRSWWFSIPGVLDHEYETDSWPVLSNSNADRAADLGLGSRDSTDLLKTLRTPATITLAAASEDEKSTSIFLRSRDRPECLILLEHLRPWDYQFVTLNPETKEYSSLWNCAEVSAWIEDGELTVALIENSVADLHLSRQLKGCSVKLVDGQEFVLEPIDSPI